MCCRLALHLRVRQKRNGEYATNVASHGQRQTNGNDDVGFERLNLSGALADEVVDILVCDAEVVGLGVGGHVCSRLCSRVAREGTGSEEQGAYPRPVQAGTWRAADKMIYV